MTLAIPCRLGFWDKRHHRTRRGEDGRVQGPKPAKRGRASAALEAGGLGPHHRGAVTQPALTRFKVACAAGLPRGARPFDGKPGASRLFGGRWRAGSNRRRFGA